MPKPRFTRASTTRTLPRPALPPQTLTITGRAAFVQASAGERWHIVAAFGGKVGSLTLCVRHLPRAAVHTGASLLSADVCPYCRDRAIGARLATLTQEATDVVR